MPAPGALVWKHYAGAAVSQKRHYRVTFDGHSHYCSAFHDGGVVELLDEHDTIAQAKRACEAHHRASRGEQPAAGGERLSEAELAEIDEKIARYANCPGCLVVSRETAARLLSEIRTARAAESGSAELVACAEAFLRLLTYTGDDADGFAGSIEDRTRAALNRARTPAPGAAPATQAPDRDLCKEALRDLLHLQQVEEHCGGYPDMPERWRKAWGLAAEVFEP